jgi:glycosyltransferase involved in cell wall biosynthesis
MLKILDHAWHQAHSYRLHALPATFEYYVPLGVRYWEPSIRPAPPNFLGYVEHPDLQSYDVILSHLDNWCDRAEMRGTPFRIMNLIGMQSAAKRIAIMHGTPDNEENRLNIERMFDRAPGGAPFMVCNSEQAYRDWGFGPGRSRAIIHGYDVDEFSISNQRQAWAVTCCSAGQISRSYHGVPLLERIRREVPVLWVGLNGDLPYFDGYAAYREFLSHSLIYVHTGQRSPMPGARTEAMLSGCCIVTTSNNDADKYIEDGVTGFLCDSADSMIETLKMLLADPRQAYLVGKRGREAARSFFHKARFVDDWLSLLHDLGVA